MSTLPQTLKLLRSPLAPVVAGVRFWLDHGAPVRRARLLCGLADGIRMRRLREWESRSNRLYRRAASALAALGPTEKGDAPGEAAEWGGVAKQALGQAQRPYRAFAAGLAVLAAEVAAGACLLVLLACAVSLDLRHRLLPRDLAKGMPWIVRDGDSRILFQGDGPSADFVHLFHTENIENPSLQIDLGAEHVIRSIRVDNRSDCCKERALPLNVEIYDGSTWRLIAQRRSYFTTWSYDVEPVSARLVRIRRPGRNFFHLKRVSIYGQ
jgi:hypothetical protein